MVNLLYHISVGFSLFLLVHIILAHTVLKKYKYKTDIHETPQIIQQKYFDGRTDGQKAFENIHFISAVREEKQKMNTFIFTSESVTEGHPDKVSDIMELLTNSENPRLFC